jgi:hypothetical protein
MQQERGVSPLAKEEELQQSSRSLHATDRSCAPASSWRSPMPARSAAEAVLAARVGGEGEGGRRPWSSGEEGSTTREGRPCLVVPTPGGLLVVPATTAASSSFSCRRGWDQPRPCAPTRMGSPVPRGGATSYPRRRVLPCGSAPAARAGGGDGRRGLLACSRADLPRPPPARRAEKEDGGGVDPRVPLHTTVDGVARTAHEDGGGA